MKTKSSLILYLPESPLPLGRADSETGKVLRYFVPPQQKGNKHLTRYKEVSPKGLAARFSRITNYKDVYFFAEEYGPLGLTGRQPKNIYRSPLYGSSGKEDMAWWYGHAAVVRQLLRLYNILSRAKKKAEYDAEDALLNVLQFKWKGSRARLFCIETGQGLNISIGEDMSPSEIAAFVLSAILSRMLQGGINIGFESFTPAEDTIPGFRVKEYRYTRFLLAAIYYDLWEMVTDNRPVIACGFCGRVFEKSGRRKYCPDNNDTCKQKAYYYRKKST